MPIVPPVSNVSPTFIPNNVDNILHENDNNTGVEGVEVGVEEQNPGVERVEPSNTSNDLTAPPTQTQSPPTYSLPT